MSILLFKYIEDCDTFQECSLNVDILTFEIPRKLSKVDAPSSMRILK